MQALTHERDNLKSRLMAARARVDSLIDRLLAASALLPGEPAQGTRSLSVGARGNPSPVAGAATIPRHETGRRGPGLTSPS